MKLVVIVIECRKCSKTNRLLISEASRGRPLCVSCRSALLECTAVNGFVYVLSNPAMPGLLKIGCTERSVEERVKELNAATGVPGSFNNEAYFAAQDPNTDERTAHHLLKHCRKDKEFFETKASEAMETIATALCRRPLVGIGSRSSGSTKAGNTQVLC